MNVYHTNLTSLMQRCCTSMHDDHKNLTCLCTSSKTLVISSFLLFLQPTLIWNGGSCNKTKPQSKFQCILVEKRTDIMEKIGFLNNYWLVQWFYVRIIITNASTSSYILQWRKRASWLWTWQEQSPTLQTDMPRALQYICTQIKNADVFD